MSNYFPNDGEKSAAANSFAGKPRLFGQAYKTHGTHSADRVFSSARQTAVIPNVKSVEYPLSFELIENAVKQL